MAAKDEILSAGKIAKEIGAKPAQVKKAISDLALEPAKVKGACKYYDQGQISQIKKNIGG